MLNLIRPDAFPTGVTAFFTGKNPGADRDAIARHLRISPEHVYLPIQQHTDKIVLIESAADLSEPKIGDSVITTLKGVLIGVRVADCVPVLIACDGREIVAAVHAGWRGTAQEILKKTLVLFIERFHCDPQHISIAIGPSIRGCCYEVDHEVAEGIRKASGEGDYVSEKGEKFCVDLSEANRRQAISSGVPAERVWLSEDCTFCNPDRFFSCRFARGTAGRQGGFIGVM